MTLKNHKPHFNVKFLKGYGCAVNLKGNEVTLKNGLSPFSDSREIETFFVTKIPYEKIIMSELGPLYEKTGVSERPDIWVITGTMNIANKILEIIESCRKEVLIAVPKAGEELVKQALPRIRQLYDKGVKVTILTSDKFDKNTVKGLTRVAVVKIKKGLFGGGIISDKRYVVILLGPEISHSNTSEIVAICTDHAGLSGFATEYFEYLLKDASEVK